MQSCGELQAKRGPINFKIKGILETGEGIVTSLLINKLKKQGDDYLSRWRAYPVLLEAGRDRGREAHPT